MHPQWTESVQAEDPCLVMRARLCSRRPYSSSFQVLTLTTGRNSLVSRLLSIVADGCMHAAWNDSTAAHLSLDLLGHDRYVHRRNWVRGIQVRLAGADVDAVEDGGVGVDGQQRHVMAHTQVPASAPLRTH